MKRTIIALFLALPTFAQECSHLWVKDLAISPPGPKGFVGDTYAAYGLMGYRNVKNLGWHVSGKFPKARFMSIETYTTDKKKQYDVLFDYKFPASIGSQNPFVEGVPMNTPNRDFEVDLIPHVGKSTDPNIVHISPTEKVIAVYYRIYVPSEHVTVTEDDLPKLKAYDVTTGQPMNCPEPVTVAFAPNWPQLITKVIPTKKKFEFESVKDTFFASAANNGNNAAIRDYRVGMNKVRSNMVVVKFKAPTFFDNFSGTGPFQETGDVRYWSLCTQNIVKGHTLNCLADYLAKVDSAGVVTVVVGKGDDVKEAVLARGYNFLEDKRKSDQPVLQLIYRNMLPNTDFEKTSMYQGEYNPHGVMCSKKQFLAGDC
jgi:hypothetical protein